ncbi:MAG: nuclear transport factor 2 family protein [Sphingomonadales bacterium]|nr:nuclear transport factor 2 family protein [Sphingomonadales bacterium]
MTSLEDRIRRLEDRAAIQDLVADYFRATDDDDIAALAQCFTRDARFVATGFPGGHGREGIVDFLVAARAAMSQTVHTPNYVHIAFAADGDHADGTVMAHLEIGIGATTVFAAVRYLDSYAREEGCWRIARREMRSVHLGPWADVARSLVDPLNVRWPGGEPGPSDFPRKP